MKKTILLLLGFLPGFAFSQTFTTTSVVLIPDNGPEVYDSLVVSGLPSVIDSTFGLTGMCFDITHTWDADLKIRLKAPNGNTIFIANGIGHDGDDFTGTCIAENGATGYLENGSAPFTGIWIPLESLNQLNNGQNPNGTWVLEIEDVANNDSGDVHNFSLTFGSNPPPDPGPAPFLCNFCDCPPGMSPPCDLLPDMTASALSISKDINATTHHSAYEVPGNINFDNATPNIGWGPLEILPVDSCYCGTTLVPCSTSVCPGGGSVKQMVRQVVYQKISAGDTLTTYTRTAGFMSYHPSHGHIHVDNWAEFSLRTPTANPDATTWPIVGTGTKTSFCLINLGDCDAQPGYCVDTSGTVLTQAAITNAGLGFFTGCGQHQGIYVGKLDIYVVGLNLGIDLTGVCNGNYFIVSITDPDSNMLETNESNNWAAVPVTLYRQDPDASFTTGLNGMQATVHALNLVNASSYTWDFGDGSALVSNVNPAVHTYTSGGNFNITLTVNSPCGAGIFSKVDTVHFSTVGLNDAPLAADEFINSTPNPANEIINVTYNLTNTGNIKVELYDLLGKKVTTLAEGKESQGIHSVKLNTKSTGLASGTYYLKLITADNIYTKKIEVTN